MQKVNNCYVSAMQMNREFFRGFCFAYYQQRPSWVDWCGGGPIDNGAVR